MLSDILNVLGNGIISNSGGKLGSANLTALSNTVSPGVTNFLTNYRTYDNTKPKAYLNWILFDDQFNFVASNSGVQQVQPGTNKQALAAPLQTISKNGYLYVYLSNESQQDVYFDDLTVKHYTGSLAQEQSFYPFGLQMAGISDKALLKQTSPYKFNGGGELEEDYGVNLYNTPFRKYDPQIGRFTGVDILSEFASSINPYHFGANNPISMNDPSGLMNVYTPKTLQKFIDNFNQWDMETGRSSGQYSDGLGNFYDDGSGGGGGGGSSAAQIENGFAFSGIAARQFFSGLQYAYNNPNADGDWSFTVGTNNKGNIGYWNSYNYSINNGNGNTLGEVIGINTWVSLDQRRVLKYLCGDNWYKWTPYTNNTQSAVIQGLYLTIAPDNPAQGAPIFFSYNTLTVIAPKSSAQSGVASTLVNIAWNKAVQDVTTLLNSEKIQPLENIVRKQFESMFITNSESWGLQIFMNTVPFGIKFDDAHVSFAKFCDNIFQ